MAAVTSPNMGLVFDKPKIDIPRIALQDGMNFRVKNGTLESLNLGWVPFSTNFTLNGSVQLIDNFFPRNQNEKLIFGTSTDLYLYNPIPDDVTYITPVYVAGTAASAGTAVTGIGTLWNTNPRIQPGDKIYFGSATQTSTHVTWYEVDHVVDDTHLVLVATSGVKVNGPYTIRRLFQDAANVTWSVDTFVNDGASGDDLWFATNGLDAPVTWNGTDVFAKRHDELGFTCKTLTTYSNMMVYGNITTLGNFLFSSIINSDVGLPLHAGNTGTGLSEQFVVHSNTDEILNMIPIGDYLIVYSERTIVPIQFVGDPIIFTFRVAISGVGPISGNAIADFGDFHEFIGSDAGYLFDGVTLKTTNEHVWREILRQTDPVRRKEAYGHFDEEQGDLIWIIPNTTDPGVGTIGAPPTIGWTEHYLETASDPNFDGSPFSKRYIPFTITGFYERVTGSLWSDMTFAWQTANFAWNDQFFQLAFPLNIAGDEDGKIWTFNTAQKANGVALPSFVRTGRQALSSGRERDLLTRVYPFSHSLPFMLDVGLYVTQFIGGPANKVAQVKFDQSLPEGQNFVTFYRRARAVEFFFGSDAGEPWVLDGWDFDSVKGGMR